MGARATSLLDATSLAGGAAAGRLAERAKEELLSFPATHLPGLPLHVRISVQISGFAHSITLLSHSSASVGAAAGIVFSGDELRAIAVAVQAERMWPADFKGFCLHKLHDASFRLGAQLALAGAQPSSAAAWPLGRVLRWLDLDLIDFALIDDAGPVQPDAAAA